MYCILVTGIPAAGKSTIAAELSNHLLFPVVSKDSIKELLFDELGFESREEKVRLGIASMKIMLYFAEQLMKRDKAFILENNFEKVFEEELISCLQKYGYKAITVTLTGNYDTIYARYAERNSSPDRHRGHVVNDCYPEKNVGAVVPPIPYEWYVSGIRSRGMDTFCGNGPQIVVDTTDFSRVDIRDLVDKIRAITDSMR